MYSTVMRSQFAEEVGQKFPGSMRDVVPPERRLHQRFAMVAKSEYTVAGTRGQATTTDISSGGVFLKTEATLPLGAEAQVLVDWPALLDGRCRLRLVIYGRVLRSDARGTAVRLVRYDFRVGPSCSPSRPS